MCCTMSQEPARAHMRMHALISRTYNCVQRSGQLAASTVRALQCCLPLQPIDSTADLRPIMAKTSHGALLHGPRSQKWQLQGKYARTAADVRLHVEHQQRVVQAGA
jgi:hypothetical protein